MSDRFKATALTGMVPSDLYKDLLKKPKTLRDNYKELRAFIDDQIFVHNAESVATPLANIEEDIDDEVMPVSLHDPETGEIEVCMMKKKDVRNFRCL